MTKQLTKHSFITVPDRVAPILTRLSGGSTKSGQQQSGGEVQQIDSDNGADTDTENVRLRALTSVSIPTTEHVE